MTIGTDMRPFLLVHTVPGNEVVFIRFCEIVRVEQVGTTLVIATTDGARTTISGKEMESLKKYLLDHAFTAESKPVQHP